MQLLPEKRFSRHAHSSPRHSPVACLPSLCIQRKPVKRVHAPHVAGRTLHSPRDWMPSDSTSTDNAWSSRIDDPGLHAWTHACVYRAMCPADVWWWMQRK